MAKRIVALVLVLCLVFPAVALAKGKPSDTGKGNPSVDRPEHPDKPAKTDKAKNEEDVEDPDNDQEQEEPENPGQGQVNKPEKPGEQGRLHAIQVKLDKWFRMPESALKGLWNAILSIGKQIGFIPEKPVEEPPDEGGAPPDEQPS